MTMIRTAHVTRGLWANILLWTNGGIMRWHDGCPMRFVGMWMVVHAQIVPERGVILTNAEYEPVGGAEVFGPQSSTTATTHSSTTTSRIMWRSVSQLIRQTNKIRAQTSMRSFWMGWGQLWGSRVLPRFGSSFFLLFTTTVQNYLSMIWNSGKLYWRQQRKLVKYPLWLYPLR